MKLSKIKPCRGRLSVLVLALMFIFFSTGIVLAGVYVDGEFWDESLEILPYPKSYSYEGHSILLRDESNYKMGDSGMFYDPTRAANEGYIKTSWSGSYTVQNINSQVNGNIVSMNVCYDKPARDEITLTSTWLKGGDLGSVYKTSCIMTIRQCPYLDSSSFSTESRAFQRQELNLRIAQNPNYPVDLSKLSVQITDSNGNVVPYCRTLKYTVDSAGEFIDCSLEFVTKNSADEIFYYSVYAIDSRGSELSSKKSFTVLQDRAPKASINMLPTYFRDEAKTAQISALFNGSKTDDNVKISWTLPTGGTADGSEVSFQLGKVGYYSISVTATDIWEDTLDEFTASDPRKTASCSFSFRVDNRAPFLKTNTVLKSFELLLINSDGSGEADLIDQMLEAGYELSIVPVSIDKSEAASALSLAGEIDISGGRSDLDQSSFWEHAQNIDDKYFFKLFSQSVRRKQAYQTMYIYRYTLDDLGSDPAVFQIPADYFTDADWESDGLMGSDIEGKYLILNINSGSLIMDKESGFIYPKLDIKLGYTGICVGDYMYCLCDDGIYKVEISTGSCSLIESCQCLQNKDGSARLIFGKVYFPVKIDDTIYSCCLDKSSGKIQKTVLYQSSGTDYLLAISPVGNMYFECNNTSSSCFRSFNRNGEALFSELTISRAKPFTRSSYKTCQFAQPVYDCYGEVNYIFVPSGTSNYSPGISLVLYHLRTGDSTEMDSGNAFWGTDHTADFTSGILGLQMADGSVTAGLGTNYNADNSSYTGFVLSMDPSGKIVSELSGYDGHIEYQTHHNSYYALSYTYDGEFKTYIYKFNEGYSAKSMRLSMEMLSGTKDYMEMSDRCDASALLAGKSSNASDPEPVVRYFSKGDVITLEDFGFSSSNYDDYERDSLIEKTSISFPYTCSETGRYSFYFWVRDDTGNEAFNKNSKKLLGIFFVDSTEDDYEDGLGDTEIPGDETRGNKSFVLHRKY